MDANKDEAIKCVLLARTRLAAGQRDSARRFVAKAIRLYPGVDISGLEFLIEASTNSRHASQERRTSAKQNSQADPSERSRDSSETRAEPVFTKAQAESVRKVLACKDYYELLGVSKESPEEDIRRAYKSLALKFHPDKNRAPGATEAFKKIGTALNVLTDPEKRRRYDQFGTEEEQVPRVTRMHRHGDPFFQYDADVFTMFFNGGFPFSQVYRGHRQRPAGSRESERENNYFVYVQLIPLILIFVLSFFSNLFIKEPYYNLSRSSKYPIERQTSQYHVQYFVKPTFEDDFDGHLGRLEAQIEEDFRNTLRLRCYHERENKEILLYRARHYGDDLGFERASRMQLPSCDRLVEVFGG
ncbi:unnamed protein product [Calicophoron daubneyi]|uniref:J domain-containing protein n=1 Tax=Calicophoron daubneyi TaxID=300641 RepID=A0AAV2TGM6_CALDB